MNFRGLTTAILLIFSQPLVADISITFLGNEGVLLSDDSNKVLIDGFLAEPFAIYEGLTEPARALQSRAAAPFDKIGLALASHQHFDHFQPDQACRFLKASPATLFVSSPQVQALLKDRCKPFAASHKNIRTVVPALGVSELLRQGGYSAEIFPLSHGVGKYAKLQNYGHLVEIGGMTVLHIGDAAMDPADFIVAGLQNRQLDVALIPYWFLVQTTGRQLVAQYMNARHKIAVHIPPKEFQEIKTILADEMPEVMVFDSRMSELRFSAQ